MRWSFVAALVAATLGCVVDSDSPVPAIDARALQSHVRFLAHDLLEGRGVGTRGEALATEYLATQLAMAGAEPGAGDGTYFQSVPLVEIRAQPDSVLRLAGEEMIPARDYVGNNERQTGREVFVADLVYVGHGITAPEFEWDDYKDTDVRGKVVVLFTNEPPSRDDSFFGGPALTYYGRWTYKYEEAARRGAIGALIVHTDETAGYPWDVVRNSGSGGRPYVEVQAGESKLALAGWLTSSAGERVFSRSATTSGKSLGDLLDMANRKDFTPIPLNLPAEADLRSSIVPITTRNVIGRLPGRDPALRDEAVLYTAHWDHIGMREEGQGEDGIYNGAVDNATGCAVLLEIARIFGQTDERPGRSVLIVFVGAEESGLLGSAYYAANPVVPVGKTAVNLNFDALYPHGATTDYSLPGYERTTLRMTVEDLAAKFGVSLTPDAHPEQGYYYRSDQFSLARHGVPAFSLRSGSQYVGRPAGWGEERVTEFRSQHYHQPSDEYRDDWDFAGIVGSAQFGLELGRIVGDQPDLPTWVEGDEFRAARDRSWQQ